MSDQVFEVRCADCGDIVGVNIWINTEGVACVSGGCYTGLITAPEDNIRDDALLVDQELDMERDLGEGDHIVVYTECEDCCNVCD